MPTFNPPTRDEAFSRESMYGTVASLFARITRKVGKTVYKDTNGDWHTKVSPTQLTLADTAVVAPADLPGGEDGRYVFLGGHTYVVSAAIGDELTAAGYTVDP